MAATSNDPGQPKIIYGPREVIYGGLEANSQTFKAGALVYSNSGAITLAAVGDVPVLGIALKDATNVTSGNIEIPVLRISTDNVVAIQVTDGSGTKEAANTTCTAGVAYDFEINSGEFNIASDDTTNPKFVFQEPIYDVNGDATYWGKFKIYYLEAQAIAG